MKPLSAAALIAGGLLGWYAAGQLAARVDSPLLRYPVILVAGIAFGLLVGSLFWRRRERGGPGSGGGAI